MISRYGNSMRLFAIHFPSNMFLGLEIIFFPKARLSRPVLCSPLERLSSLTNRVALAIEGIMQESMLNSYFSRYVYD